MASSFCNVVKKTVWTWLEYLDKFGCQIPRSGCTPVITGQKYPIFINGSGGDDKAAREPCHCGGSIKKILFVLFCHIKTH